MIYRDRVGLQIVTDEVGKYRPMTNWDCPNCGETNIDFVDWDTHCAKCGRVVMVMGEDEGVIDQKYFAELT